MAKKKWNNIDLNKFFAGQQGPAAPIRLGNQQPKVTRKVPSQGRVKIPEPGPKVPKGTAPNAGGKTTRERLNNLRDLNPTGSTSPSFEPITFDLIAKDEDRLLLKNNLYDRLTEARAAGDRAEETRLMRLIRNTEELRKAKARPYGTPGIIESLESKIAKDIAADPQRSLARGALEKTFGLEVNMYDPRAARWTAFEANQTTAERIASGSSVGLRDVRTNPKKFRPISKSQRKKSKQISKELHEEYLRTNIKEHEKLFIKGVENDIGNGTGVPYNIRVGKKMPGMLQGMEDIGLPLGSNQRVTGAKQAILNLEVDSLGIASPADELTKVSVAEGRSNLLGRIDVTLQHDAMPVSQTGPWAEKLTPKERMAAYKEEMEVLKQRRKDFKLHLNSFYGTYGQNTEMGMGLPEHGRVMFGAPDWMQGYGAINKQNSELDKMASRHLKDQQKMIIEAQRAEVQAKVNAIPLNFETNKGLAARYTTDGAQAIIRSEAAQVAARTSETVTQEAAKMTNRTAGIIAEDTMRAASVLHSSKLGGAAVGTMAIMGAFGIMSLKGSQSRKQKEVTGR